MRDGVASRNVNQGLACSTPRHIACGIGVTILTLDDVIASAGGIPLMANGKIIGAIGVSGGPTGVIDSGPAQAGADALK